MISLELTPPGSPRSEPTNTMTRHEIHERQKQLLIGVHRLNTRIASFFKVIRLKNHLDYETDTRMGIILDFVPFLHCFSEIQVSDQNFEQIGASKWNEV